MTDRYCPICGSQAFTRHTNPGGWCDPCWLEKENDEVELELWGMMNGKTDKQSSKMLREVQPVHRSGLSEKGPVPEISELSAAGS